MSTTKASGLPISATKSSIHNVQLALCDAFSWYDYPPTRPMLRWSDVWDELEKLYKDAAP